MFSSSFVRWWGCGLWWKLQAFGTADLPRSPGLCLADGRLVQLHLGWRQIGTRVTNHQILVCLGWKFISFLLLLKWCFGTSCFGIVVILVVILRASEGAKGACWLVWQVWQQYASIVYATLCHFTKGMKMWWILALKAPYYCNNWRFDLH